jgi:glutamate-1-semialdehyde 2,1-aminomutase
VIATLAFYIPGAVVLLLILRKARLRLQLSLAKHRSLAGHARWSRRFAALLHFYEYGESEFFAADSAPVAVVTERRAGFARLAALFAQRFEKSASLTASLHNGISDLQLTSRYRVPFQFSSFVRQHLKVGSVLQSSSGPTVTDLDGNELYDLTGAYGVNVFGYDFYKTCIECKLSTPLFRRWALQCTRD